MTTPLGEASMSALAIAGGCDCRRVRYRLDSTPLYVHACHCSWCQRETGSAFVLNAMIEADRVVTLGVEPEVVDTPSASGEGQRIARCPVCRVAVWSWYSGSGPAVRFVRVGTLDDPERCPPDIHIFTASKQSWFVLPSETPAVPEYYDRERHWPAASLERRRALLPKIESWQSQLRDRQVETTRSFDAPREQVFTAFLDPARLARWWGPDGFTNVFDTFEPWAGGDWKFVMRGPDGHEHPNRTVFVDVAPPRHVRLRHVSKPTFELLIRLEEHGPARTVVHWRQRFDEAETCRRLAPIVVPSNEQNLDRWQRIVAEMTG